MSAFGEIVNDHQLELTRELEAQGKIFAVYDVGNLRPVVERAMANRETHTSVRKETRIVGIVKDFLDEIKVRKDGCR